MSKQFSYLVRHRMGRKKGDTSQLSAQLAPLEEQSPEHQESIARGVEQESGAIVVKHDGHNLSADLVDAPASGGGFMGMEPVVLLIVGLMLAFIAFIAWQVSQMPGE